MLIICAIVGFVIVLVIVIVAAVIATLPDPVIISEGNWNHTVILEYFNIKE